MPVRSLGPHVDSRAWKDQGAGKGSGPVRDVGSAPYGYRPQEYPQPRKKHPFLIVLGIVGILAIIGALAAVMVGASIRAMNSAKLEQYFVDGKLATCDIGADFYDAVGWKDARRDYSSEKFCYGWAETAEGEVSVEIYLDEEPLDGAIAPSDVAGWSEITSTQPHNPWCIMTSGDPALSAVSLFVPAPCEPLYRMAQELGQLAADATGKKSPSEDQVHTSEPVSVASDEYSELLSTADHIGTKKNVRSVDVKEATLQPKEVKISPFASLQTEEKSEVCVDLILNIAAFSDSIGESESFKLPVLGVMTPAGTITWLETTGEEGSYSLSQDVSTTFCGEYTGEFRETTLLLVEYVESSKEEPAVWKFELGGETGI